MLGAQDLIVLKPHGSLKFFLEHNLATKELPNSLRFTVKKNIYIKWILIGKV